MPSKVRFREFARLRIAAASPRTSANQTPVGDHSRDALYWCEHCRRRVRGRVNCDMQVLAAPARKSVNFARLSKWPALATSAILAGAFTILSPPPRVRETIAQERRLAIYDAFWAQITKHYFDPQFSGVDWNLVRQEWRKKAAAASSDLDLYGVLYNIGLGFPASHIAAQAPSKLLLHHAAAKCRPADREG